MILQSNTHNKVQKAACSEFLIRETSHLNTTKYDTFWKKYRNTFTDKHTNNKDLSVPLDESQPCCQSSKGHIIG